MSTILVYSAVKRLKFIAIIENIHIHLKRKFPTEFFHDNLSVLKQYAAQQIKPQAKVLH